jgi:hypothetical protein
VHYCKAGHPLKVAGIPGDYDALDDVSARRDQSIGNLDASGLANLNGAFDDGIAYGNFVELIKEPADSPLFVVSQVGKVKHVDPAVVP